MKRFKPFKSWIGLLSICISVLMLIGCSSDDTLTAPMQHTIEISELYLTDLLLDPGETTTVIATFDYSGDEADLIFRWATDSGQIVGDGSTVTYIASNTPGSDTIRLELTDGFANAELSIMVEIVALESLLVDSDTYWAVQDEKTPLLKYRVSVTRILQQPVTLRYDILQDKAKTGGFLSLEVDGIVLVDEEAIGEAHPAEGVVITGQINVSRIITGPGVYEIVLTLAVANPIERGWLLQMTELIGAAGSAVRLL